MSDLFRGAAGEMVGRIPIRRGPAETRKIARSLGKLCEGGEVIALIGGLGAGKTCFVQGLARGLDVPSEERVASPTYNIVLEHTGRLPLYHIDLYRLVDAGELSDLGLEQYVHGQGVCAVEWIDRFPELLGRDYLEVRITAIEADPKARMLDVTGRGPRSSQLVEKWLTETTRRG